MVDAGGLLFHTTQPSRFKNCYIVENDKPTTALNFNPQGWWLDLSPITRVVYGLDLEAPERYECYPKLITASVIFFLSSLYCTYPFRLLASTLPPRWWKMSSVFQNRPTASSWISRSTGTTASCTCSPTSLCYTFSSKGKEQFLELGIIA